MAKAKAIVEQDLTVEDKLKALFDLQTIDTEIDKIKILRGELPLEVQDLEDDIAGLETRILNFNEEIKNFEVEIAAKKNQIGESQTLIKKYEGQQMNVRNNREYDSLSKEIEFQNLEIQLCEKRIKEYTEKVEERKKIIEDSKVVLKEREKDLLQKKSELEQIVSETQKEEQQLNDKSAEYEKIIEPRLLTAYKRIRGNARNGLAVVIVQRDACGGCFNKIPPQRQLDIRSRKKIIVCEYCGRILIDNELGAN